MATIWCITGCTVALMTTIAIQCEMVIWRYEIEFHHEPIADPTAWMTLGIAYNRQNLFMFDCRPNCYCLMWSRLKPGFHYPSWRPELTARVDGWPVSITRQHGPCWRARVSTSRVDSSQLGPLTRTVNSGSGNRALVLLLLMFRFHRSFISFYI